MKQVGKFGTIEYLLELPDLRIGNILWYKGKLVYVTCLSMDIDDEYQEQINFCYLGTSTNEMGGWNRSLVKDLYPVTITEEIINQMQMNQGFDFGDHFRVRFQKLFGQLVPTLEQYSEGQEPLSNIKYLHQLQNFYFIITGKELSLT